MYCRYATVSDRLQNDYRTSLRHESKPRKQGRKRLEEGVFCVPCIRSSELKTATQNTNTTEFSVRLQTNHQHENT